MSKLGRIPIELPKEVKLEVKGSSLLIKGPKGEFTYTLSKGISLKQEGGKIIISKETDVRMLRELQGLTRALVVNMIEGVSKGFRKELDIIGVGYKVQTNSNKLVMQLGFSHPVEIVQEPGLKISCPTPNKIIIEGIDKQKVGEFAARLRRIKPPEPYKGKGIRYTGEYVRKKLGKAMAKA